MRRPGFRARDFAPADEAEQSPIARQCRRSNASYACAGTRNKRGALPLPIWGAGWVRGLPAVVIDPTPLTHSLMLRKTSSPAACSQAVTILNRSDFLRDDRPRGAAAHRRARFCGPEP